MALRPSSLVIDAQDLKRAAAFWAEALGYEATSASDGWVSLSDPKGKGVDVAFQHDAEAKRGVNRIHLDLAATDVPAEVARLERLGAKRADWPHYPPQPTYVVMLDPEGNEFCVVPE